MPAMRTSLDPRTASYADTRSAMLGRLAALDRAIDEVCAAGTRDSARYRAVGLRPPRERIELLLDRDAPFLELRPLAGWAEFDHGDGPAAPPAGLVGGLGTVCGARCVVVADAPGVRETDRHGPAKLERLATLAAAYRLPLVRLALAGSGIELACHVDVFLPGRGYPLGRADYRVAVPAPDGKPLPDADALAPDDRDAIGLARAFLRRTVPPAPPVRPGRVPLHDAEDLLAVPAGDPDRYDPREVLARVLDGSEFDEFQPQRGGCLAGWGELAAYPVGILADRPGEPAGASATKVADFARLAGGAGLPVLVLRAATAGSPMPAPAWDRCVTVRLAGAEGPGIAHRPGLTLSWPGPDGPGDPLDDAVIDPRDTRTVLCVALAAMGGGAGRHAAVPHSRAALPDGTVAPPAGSATPLAGVAR